jgi:hypothetical protein
MSIDALVARDGLERYRWRNKPVFLHEDHRWVLPLIAQAQEDGLLSRPTPVVLFDRHTDAAEPGKLTSDISVEGLLRCCEQELSHHDDDWIVAGIRLGLLADVFIFGVDDRIGDLPKAVGDFAIMGRFEMPGHLGAVGQRAQALLESTKGPILLDIDLDCFAFPYRGQVWPWNQDMFEQQLHPSWRSLLDRAGIVTVCREAGCCGSEENANVIWSLLQTTLFCGELEKNVELS